MPSERGNGPRRSICRRSMGAPVLMSWSLPCLGPHPENTGYKGRMSDRKCLNPISNSTSNLGAAPVVAFYRCSSDRKHFRESPSTDHFSFHMGPTIAKTRHFRRSQYTGGRLPRFPMSARPTGHSRLLSPGCKASILECPVFLCLTSTTPAARSGKLVIDILITWRPSRPKRRRVASLHARLVFFTRTGLLPRSHSLQPRVAHLASHCTGGFSFIF